MKHSQFLLTLLLCVGLLFQPKAEDNSSLTQAQLQLEEMGEVYFRFQAISAEQIEQMNDVVSIDKYKLRNVYAFANKNEFQNFLKYNLEYEVLTPPCMEIPKPVMSDYSGPRADWDWTKYPTYSGYKRIMDELQAAYPDKVKVMKFGESIRGRDLLVAKVSDNVNEKDPEPAFYFSGAVHGNETCGTMCMLRMIEWLCENYTKDPRAKRIIDSTELWINPWHNPDGTYYGGNNDVSRARRYNASGKDLNRNYPKVPGAGQSDRPEKETKAHIKLATDNFFVMNIDFHGGVETAIYPYSAIARRTPDDRWWKYVCRVYADLAQRNGPSGYFNDCDDGICNGYADLGYVARGTTKDYFYMFKHTRGISLEMTATKLVPESRLNTYWNANRDALIAYTLEMLNGIRGTVTANNGRKLGAKVFVKNHDTRTDSSWVHADLPHGNYYRPIYAGTYSVEFSHDSCESKTVNNIRVRNGQATIVDVELNCDFVGVENRLKNLAKEVTVIPLGNMIKINWQNLNRGVNVAIFDMHGRMVRHLDTKSMLKTQSLFWDGKNMYGRRVSSGCYVIHINTEQGKFTKPFIYE